MVSFLLIVVFLHLSKQTTTTNYFKIVPSFVVISSNGFGDIIVKLDKNVF